MGKKRNENASQSKKGGTVTITETEKPPKGARDDEIDLARFLEEPWKRYGILIANEFWTENYRMKALPPLDPGAPEFAAITGAPAATLKSGNYYIKYRDVTLAVAISGKVTFYPGPFLVGGICQLYEFLQDSQYGAGLPDGDAKEILAKFELIYLEAEARVLADLEGSLPRERAKLAEVKILPAGKFREMKSDVFVDFSKGGEIGARGDPELSVALESTITRAAETVTFFFTYLREVRAYQDQINAMTRDSNGNFQQVVQVLEEYDARLNQFGRAQQLFNKDIAELLKRPDSTETNEILTRILAELVLNNDTRTQDHADLIVAIRDTANEQVVQITAALEQTNRVLESLGTETDARYQALRRDVGQLSLDLYEHDFRTEIEHAGQKAILANMDAKVARLAERFDREVSVLKSEVEAIRTEIKGIQADLIRQGQMRYKFQKRSLRAFSAILWILRQLPEATARQVADALQEPSTRIHNRLNRMRELGILGREKKRSQKKEPNSTSQDQGSDPDPQERYRKTTRKIFHYFIKRKKIHGKNKGKNGPDADRGRVDKSPVKGRSKDERRGRRSEMS